MKKTLNFLKRISLFPGLLFLISLISCNPTTSRGNSYQQFIGNKDYVSPKNVSTSDADNQSTSLESNWWKKSSFYHIWIKSFADSNNDGIGDFKGIESKLDYIQNQVGCDSIWLSPAFKCAGTGSNMHGYDTTDYYGVNPMFGTEEDLISLITSCHERGMKIIFDFVPNHTSTEHPWFINSCNNSDKKDWYVWNKTKTNINSGMGSSGWTLNNGMYYYGAFSSSMPDLNYYNYEVREEMKNVARYWLNKGFDGLRLDGARYLMEEGTLGCDTDSSHDFYKELRLELNKYSSPKFMVCESWVTQNRNCLNKYFGDDNEFNMVFDFDQGTRCITSVYNKTKEDDWIFFQNPGQNRSYGVFLGNHDEYAVYESGNGSSVKLSSFWSSSATNYIRFGQALKGDRKQINQSLALSIIRPNVPFIYYGNELGQKEIAAGGDMRARGPFNWQKAESQAESNISSLNFTKAANSLRKLYPETFANGEIKVLSTSSKNTIAYTISGTDGNLLIILNLANTKMSSVTFKSSMNIDNAKIVIGNNSSPDLSKNESKISIAELGPRAIRVYDLSGTYSGELLFNDDDYEEIYIPTTDTNKEVTISTQMFLRGSMLNNWSGYQQMTKTIENGDTIWKCTITLTSGTYQFKFADTSDWSGSDWGSDLSVSGGITKASDSHKNLSYTASSAGTYTFIFNQTQQTATVDKQ